MEEERLKYEDFIKKQTKKYKDQGFDDDQARFQAGFDAGKQGLAVNMKLYDEAKQNMVENNTKIDKIEKARAAMAKGNYKEVEDILSGHNYNIANLNKQSVDDLNKNIGEAKAMRDAANTMYKETGDEKYKQMAEQYQKDIDQMQNALDAQKGVLSTNSQGYKDAWSSYTKAGVEGAYGKASDFNAVGQLLIKELSGGVSQAEIEGVGAVQRVGDKMILTVDGMDYVFNSSGQLLGSNMTLGIETGFKNNESAIYTKAGQIREKAIAEYAKGKWVGTGANAVYQIAEGTEINGKKIKEKMQITKDGTVRVWDEKKGEYYNAGKAVCDGTKIGIDDNCDGIITSFGNSAINALSSFKSVFGIKSPSRVMKTMGKYIMQGLGIGVDENAKSPLASIKNVAKTMVGSFQKEMSIGFNPDLNMVAKITADQSNVKMQAEQLRASFISGAISADKTPSSATKEYNTEVHITSPKPLSESEISDEMALMFRRMEWDL